VKRLVFLCFVVLCGCKVQQSWMEPHPSFERMMQQAKVNPFDESTFFDDGIAMRTPPRGTVSLEQTIGDRLFVDGMVDGVYAQIIPMEVKRDVLERGRERFEVYCSACHGVDGFGESVVAENMALRRPPSLHEDRIVALPPGRLYQVIRTGYGLMPPYAAQLTVRDRWAVVAYLRALQLSRRVDVAQLTPELRAQLEEATR